MELIKILSLFFIIQFLASNENALAQQKDSIQYRGKTITTPKTVKDLTEDYLFFEKGREKSLELNDTIGIVYNLSMLAIIDFELDFLYESEKDAVQALELLDKIKESEWKSQTTVSLYNSLGKVHRALKDQEKALNSYDKVLELTQKLNDSVKAYNNKGNVFKDEKKYEEALIQFELGYQASLRNKDSIENARVLDNLGYTQSKLGHFIGFSNMIQALEIRVLKNDTKGVFASYLNLTEYYDERGKLDSALYYANKSYDLAKKINSLKYKEEALSNLLKFDEKAEYNEYISIVDSLDQRKLDQDVKFSHAKYDVDRERRNALSQKLKDEAKNKRQRLIFIGVGFLLLISATFLYFIQRINFKREKAKEIIKETFQTERRLSKKVHDELANDMSDTLNYIDHHMAIPDDVKRHLVNKLDDLYDRTRDISAEIGGFDSKDFAKSLKFLITQHNTKGLKVMTNVMSGIVWDKVSNHKKINIYRSLQELLVNMKKHSNATDVTVIFKSEGKKHTINYTDNGVGTDLGDKRIRGLQNVETRMKNIGGNSTFITSKGKGFKAHLYFLS